MIPLLTTWLGSWWLAELLKYTFFLKETELDYSAGFQLTEYSYVKITSSLPAPSAPWVDWQHICGAMCSDPPKNKK